MALPLEHIISRWLYNKNIGVSQHLLKEKLQTHPNYPSLLCITDTLDELGIDNAAVIIDKEKLQEVPCPFLAYDRPKRAFVAISNIQQQITNKPEFEKHWDGTALFIEKPDGWRHPGNSKRLAEEKRSRHTGFALFLFLGLLMALSLLNGYSWGLIGLLLTSMAGVFISTMIVQHGLGINNEFTEQLCGSGSDSGCDAVLHSKGSRLGKWLNWADAGIIYFISYTFLLTGFLYAGNVGGIQVLAILSLATLPFTLLSVVYQWRVVKKWCRLCLLTVSILWVQALLLLFSGVYKNIAVSSAILMPVLNMVFVFFVIAVAWLKLIKPAHEKNKNLLQEKYGLQRFKNGPELFELLLKNERKVDTSPFENDLQLGNPNAPLQIMVACNPYCGPCAKAHEALHELLEKNDIGLTVRFNVSTENKEDKKTQAIAYLLQLLHNSSPLQKRKALHGWFILMNYEKFTENYPLPENTADVMEQVLQQQQWTKVAEIKFTPTIFINGYELPQQYRASDLKYLIRNFERNDNSIKEETNELEYIPE